MRTILTAVVGPTLHGIAAWSQEWYDWLEVINVGS